MKQLVFVISNLFLFAQALLPKTSVTVVGSGMSGIAAASVLTQAGYSVTVLEARNRIGGRIWTDRTLGVPLDLGGAWIHGDSTTATKPNPLLGLAAKYKLKLYRTDENLTRRFQENGTEYTDGQVASTESLVDSLTKKLVSQYGDDSSSNLSFTQLWKSSDPINFLKPDFQYTLSELLEFDVGGSLESLTPYAYNAGLLYPGGNSILPTGYDQMLLGLLSDAGMSESSIQLNSVVNSVTTSGSKVQVKYSLNGVPMTISSDYVISTVPLGVLANGSINFYPALSNAKIKAIQNVKMGCTNKYVAKFKSTTWDSSSVFYGIDQGATPTTRGRLAEMMNVNKWSVGSNILIGFAFADSARALETLSDGDATALLLQHMQNIFIGTLPPEVSVVTRWCSDPYAFGSYSYLGAGVDATAYDDLAAIEHGGRLLFAGEHTSKNYFGTVHGAYLSGLKVANDIITAAPLPSSSSIPSSSSASSSSSSSSVVPPLSSSSSSASSSLSSVSSSSSSSMNSLSLVRCLLMLAVLGFLF